MAIVPSARRSPIHARRTRASNAARASMSACEEGTMVAMSKASVDFMGLSFRSRDDGGGDGERSRGTAPRSNVDGGRRRTEDAQRVPRGPPPELQHPPAVDPSHAA